MLLLRLMRLVIHVVVGALICMLWFPRLDAAGREMRIRHWSRRLLELCRVRVRYSGEIAPCALAVANHVSWLDIYLINALQPCRFVAKASIRSWPVVGWLSAQTGTVFLERGNPRDLRRIFHGLVTHLRQGGRFAFFPEGTTAGQGMLLPFHPNLFEAAIDAGVPVQPYALRYLDATGKPHPNIDFVGDTSLLESLMAILKGSDIIAEVMLLPPISPADASRRQLAVAARKAIATALGLGPEIAGNLPETTPDLPAARR